MSVTGFTGASRLMAGMITLSGTSGALSGAAGSAQDEQHPDGQSEQGDDAPQPDSLIHQKPVYVRCFPVIRLWRNRQEQTSRRVDYAHGGLSSLNLL